MSLELVLGQRLQIINIGLEIFARELESAGEDVVHVDWKPPGGDPRVAELLDRLDE